MIMLIEINIFIIFVIITNQLIVVGGSRTYCASPNVSEMSRKCTMATINKVPQM